MHSLTRLSLAYPRTAVVVLAAITLILGSGLPRLRTEFGYRVLIGDEHPAIRTLDRLIAEFGGALPLHIVWSCGPADPCQSVFDPVSLGMAHEVTEALRRSDLIRHVEGLSNAPLIVADAEGIAVRHFYERNALADDFKTLAMCALRDPLWVGTLVAADGKVGVIAAQPIDTRAETDIHVLDAVEEVLLPFRQQGFNFRLAGDAISTVVAGRDLAESTSKLVPGTVLVIGIVLLVLTRSWQATALVLATMGVALGWTFGLLGWLDWPQDAILEVLAPLVLVVGVCDAVHLVSRYGVESADRGETIKQRSSAMGMAAKDVGTACLVTTLTTAVAFLSFMTSDLDTFFRFGVISAFGVTACLLLTFTLLPILLSALAASGIRSERISSSWNSALNAVIATSESRRIPILVAATVLFLLCGIGWARFLRVDTDWSESFGDQSRVIQWTRFLEENLRPSRSLEVEITLPPDADIDDPRSLSAVSAFSSSLSTVEGLGSATSIVTSVERANRMLHGDDPRHQKVGATRAENAQLLELLSFEDPEMLRGWMSFDRSHLRVSVEALEQSFASRGRVLDEVRELAKSTLPRDWSVALSGNLAVGFDWIRDVQATQLRSFPIAFGLVLLIASIFLRSASLGAVAMVPTLLPVVVTLGAMGWLGMSLDVGRAMIAAILIGIGVDDSIHLLSRFRVERNAGVREAMRSAVFHTGRAVVTTSVALALGFLTLMASAWQTISSFGFFVALAIIGALGATLFVLPSLVFVLWGVRGSPGQGAGSARPPGASRTRDVAAWLAVLPVISVIGSAAVLAMRTDPIVEPVCWILPNARVLRVPGDDGCPLEPEDSIRGFRSVSGAMLPWSQMTQVSGALGAGALDVYVVRGGAEGWVEVPTTGQSSRDRLARVAAAGVAALGLLVLPLLLLRHSSSPAAVPVLYFFAAVATITVVAMSAPSSAWMTRLAVVAMIAIPAILVHLNLTFLRGRSLIRGTPGFVLVPYALCSMLLPAGWFALERDPLLWPAFMYLLIALAVGAAGVLFVSSIYAVRESESALERARARVLLYGALLVPIAPTWLLARGASGLPGFASTYLWVASVTMPLPIGFAISRYNLFDLGEQLRRTVTRTLYFAAAALTITAAFGLTRWLDVHGGALVFFGVAFACMVAIEGIRRRLTGYLEARVSPRLVELRKTGQRFFQQVYELREAPAVARLLGETLEVGLRSRSLCVFLASGPAWRPVCAQGDGPVVQVSHAEDARKLLGSQVAVQLLEGENHADPLALRLERAGVALAVALERDDETLGLVLIGGSTSGNPYTGSEIRFARAIAEHAALALQNARLAEDLVQAELQAGSARLAVTLVHQLGKELDWIRGLAKHLPSRLGDPERARRSAERIRELTDDVALRARGFLEDATHGVSRQPGTRSLDAVMGRCIELVSQRFGPGRVTQTLAPGTEWARVDESVESVLLNLLDNALRASAPDDPVHVLATLEEGWLVLSVTDRGGGMPPEVLERCFEFGFSTRHGGQGHGLGLAVSRETAETLGGSLVLASRPGEGTRAVLRLPSPPA